MTEITEQAKSALAGRASQARQAAYAPYSKFAVGAAILCQSGEIYSGCNVENVSYGLTICAERVAAGTAIAAGDREFVACAISTNGGGSPCGACRQFLAEFGPAMLILLVDAEHPEKMRELSLADLLPEQFEL